MRRFLIALAAIAMLLLPACARTETVTSGPIVFTTTATVTSPAQTTHTVTLTVPSIFTGLTLIPTTMPQAQKTSLLPISLKIRSLK
jgi:hypothetical protein